MHRIVLNMHQVYFNSQSHKEADTDIQNCNRNRRYFNSQPHKEADYVVYIIKYIYNISTHSLTRRLTSGNRIHRNSIIFQLTASQGG